MREQKVFVNVNMQIVNQNNKQEYIYRNKFIFLHHS